MAAVTLSCLVLLLSLSSSISQVVRLGSILYQPHSHTYKFEEGEIRTNLTVAVGNFTQSSNQTGWSYLEIATNEHFDDDAQAFAAGYLEAVLTREMISMHWQNTVVGDPCVPDASSPFCKRLKSFVETNLDWVSSVAVDNDPFWHQVNLFLQQLRGLEAAYYNYSSTFSVSKRTKINPFGLLLFQIDGDMEDLNEALKAPGREHGHVLGSGSCSALIKLLSGNKDLFVAHDTWSVYQSMLRILKKYDFGFHLRAGGNSPPVVSGRVMSFSSYPGVLLSGDDFYVISTGLVTLETTIGNSNPDLYKKFISPKNSVFEGLRVMAANRLSTTGRTWADMFSSYNSGTYNNQWMIVDYNKFTPGQPLNSDLLWIVEQIPGFMRANDMTSLLNSTRYWPSYNLPYFKEVQVLSGIPEMVKKYGDFFSYENAPRANIFRRDQAMVHDLDSMTRLMRYNDFKNDPYGKCKCVPPYSGENGISARCDLNPANGTYPIGALGHREHGGTDMKLTDSTMYKSLQFRAISGPTADQQPPFQWSKSDYSHLPHMGHPDIFNFGPVTHPWSLNHDFSKDKIH